MFLIVECSMSWGHRWGAHARKGGFVNKRLIALIMVVVLLFGSVSMFSRSKATVVGAEVAIEVGTVLYYIIQGVITGVEVKTIVETISTGSETYQVYKKTDGSSNTMYKFVNSNKTRIKPAVAQALVDGLTDKQLVEMANNVSINEDGMLDTGGISTATKKAVNGIMINISGSVPMYENYYTDLVERRKSLSDTQLESVRSIINKFAYSKCTTYVGNEYLYPYYAIIPVIDTYGYTGYNIYFSSTPIVIVNQRNSIIDIMPITVALTNSSGYSALNMRMHGDLMNSNNPFMYIQDYNEWMRIYIPMSGANYKFPTNVFNDNGIVAIGHGIITLDKVTYEQVLRPNPNLKYEDLIELNDKVYEIPYSLSNVDKPYTYIGKDKTEILIKDGAIPVTGDLDSVVSEFENYEKIDKENHLTWDNTQSSKNKLITDVIDNNYVDIPIDTPVDLTGVNKRLDEVIEKLGAIVGSIGDINALTDAQLREALKDLDLANTDGLTIDQVRDYATERELAQEKELENELDIDNYKVDQGIITKFPFCIPFDLINMVKKLKRTGVAPRFEVPFKINSIGIDEVIVFDFKDYEPVVVVVRWFVLFGFVGSLILVTRKLIRG